MSTPLLAGVDVSKRWLDIATSDGRSRRFDNTASGHRALVSWLSRRPCRVVIESTGTYGLGGDWKHWRPMSACRCGFCRPYD